MTRSVGDPGFLRPLLVPLVVLALALNSLLVAGETVLLGGLTLLPDGTIVTTTYGHWDAGKQPYIRTVRVLPEQLDALAGVSDP